MEAELGRRRTMVEMLANCVDSLETDLKVVLQWAQVARSLHPLLYYLLFYESYLGQNCPMQQRQTRGT